MRERNAKASASIEEYEELAVDQIAQLNRLNRPTSFKYDEDDTTMQQAELTMDFGNDFTTTQDETIREEDIEELERKKKMLEDRVNGMEKDLGGLMR